jgi:hypothetical protein
VIGAAFEEVVCEMINELVDWDYLEIGMELCDGCSPRKVSNDAQAFGLKHLGMAVIGLRVGAPDRCGVGMMERKSDLNSISLY